MNSHATPLNVLLVEDSPMLAERVAELIHAVPGVQLLATVDNEQEAVALVTNASVDAVILDLQLRGGTGFDVLRKIAPLPVHPVVIIYTNYDLPEYRRQAAMLGAAHFLDKSRDYERLGEILSEIGRHSD